MSSDYCVVTRGLSKCYQIYERPADRLKQSIVPRLERMLGKPPRTYFREFWALRDVDFEIRQGESVGVIGRNGSGKSTLLQLLCGTLTPTAGTVETQGRFAALLELGSGFNPEFTGRDNVYLNASLLGMSQTQIDERFDAIAAFADIGEHLNQPVKTYSSGMFVRLAFSVIAHVDADVLVVDEALSVGDAVFTQRCMRFIRRFQEHGTLIFVSHDTPSIQNLCPTAIWIDRGRLIRKGPSRSVSETYLKSTLQELYGDDVQLDAIETSPFGAGEGGASNAVDESTAGVARDVDEALDSIVDYGSEIVVRDNLAAARGFSTGHAEITKVCLARDGGDSVGVLAGGEWLEVSIRAVAHQELKSPIVGFLVRDRLGQDLFGENTLAAPGGTAPAIGAGEQLEARFRFRLPMLPNGQYSMMVSIADGTRQDNLQHHYLHDALILTVASARVRYGLVGVAFSRVDLKNLGAALDEASSNQDLR